MILFTADWHIKLGQKNVPVQWATNRYNKFFEQVHEITEYVICTLLGAISLIAFQAWTSCPCTSLLLEK